jgi:hypothetical protein
MNASERTKLRRFQSRIISSFIVVAASLSASALNIVTYEIYKGAAFTQSGTNAPAPSTNAPFFFEAAASPLQFISPLYVTNPAVATPGGTRLPLALSVSTNQATVTSNYVFTDSATSSNALNTAYGPGPYTLSYTGSFDGATSVVLSLASSSFPPAPVISNLVAAQSINSASNFTLQFLARPTANSNDFTQLVILDSSSNTVFSTPAPDQPPEAALIGTNSKVVISPGYLFAGQTYTGILVYTKTTTNNLYAFKGYPYFLGGYISQTIFPMQTTGGAPPPPPPPSPAPESLENSLLTFKVSGGTGPFATNAGFQLFTSPVGTNYSALGSAGSGFGSGGYAYIQTGTNTGTLTFSDTRAGVISLQISFAATGADTFVLSNSAGVETGTLTIMQGYANLQTPNLFLPGVSNNQFQAFLSGDRGVNYNIDSSTDMTNWTPLTSLSLADLTTNFTDATLTTNRYYRARTGSVALAPATISNLTFACSANSAAAPFQSNAFFQWAAVSNGNAYKIIAASGATNGSGTFSYSTTGPTTALITYTDSSTSKTYYQELLFSSTTAGFFYTTNSASSGFQSGTFTITTGPTMLFGNVSFSGDTNRARSIFFPADGTPVTLSVTDAVGYVWSLSAPGDALLTAQTLSMTPFASIDSSQCALPVLTGVQLGPDGIRFCDGVTLTLTTPSPLGRHAALLVGASDGSKLSFVQTATNASSYSTTLFHFSGAGAIDPMDQPWQQYADENLEQALEAYDEATTEAQSLIKPAVQPPEPPDYELNCTGSNPQGDQAVSNYVAALFQKESDAVNKLINAAEFLQHATGDESYFLNAQTLAIQVFESSGYRKVDALAADWNDNALKFSAVSAATFYIYRSDALLGGTAIPAAVSYLAPWLKQSVLDHYWKKLINDHDYTMAPVLISIERLISLLGVPINGTAFLQQVAQGYTFQVTMNCTDVGDKLSLSANALLTINQDPNASPGLIGISSQGSVQTMNTFTESGTYTDCTLAPSTFEQGCVFQIDCTNQTMGLFVFEEMGSLDESWSCPGGGGPSQVMVQDFSNAFQASHGTQNSVSGDHDCSYDFVVQWQNMQAQPANATFTGKGQYTANDTVTFTIQVKHTPKGPQTLTP